MFATLIPAQNILAEEESLRNQIEALRKALEDAERVADSLGAHIDACWQAAYYAKQQTITPRLHECMRLRSGVYDNKTLQRIRNQGEPEIFGNLTDPKCRATADWLNDVILPPGERPFEFTPTTIPDLPIEEKRIIIERQKAISRKELYDKYQQNGGNLSEIDVLLLLEKHAKIVTRKIYERAEYGVGLFEDIINDELEEGDWHKAIVEVIDDFVTYPTAFLKGPYYVKAPVVKTTYIQETNESIVSRDEKVIKKYSRVSPYDIYPSPRARNLDEGYLIEICHLNRSQIASLIGVDGFHENKVRQVLREFGTNVLNNWLIRDVDRDAFENKDYTSENFDGFIDAIVYWGGAQGKLLLEWGMSQEDIPDPDIEYNISAMKIGKHVIMARLNSHPTGRKPYYSASFVRNNDSVWGRSSLPELMQDIQKSGNIVFRSMIANAALASGPQVYIDQERVPDYNDRTTIHPRKIWLFTTSDLEKGIPIGFMQPQSNVHENIQLFEFLYNLAAEVTGIPSYWYGTGKGEIAGGTVGGLSMMMQAATKTLRIVAKNFAQDIVKKSIYEHWLASITDDPTRTIGDINIVVRASEYLSVLEALQGKTLELLQLTTNPIDADIIGKAGRAEMLRAVVDRLKLKTYKIVPDRWELEDGATGGSSTSMDMINALSQGLGMKPDQLIQMAQSGGRNNSGSAAVKRMPVQTSQDKGALVGVG